MAMKSYRVCDDANIVVVNTCGFIDSAVQESLDAIGEAMAENGKGHRNRLSRRKGRRNPITVSECIEVTGPSL